MAQSGSRAPLVVRERSFALDALLEPFVCSHDHERSQHLLLQLLREHADPVITTILRRKVRACFHGVARQLQDVEDIQSDIHVRLIKHLRRMKTDGRVAPIANFRDYVAVVTYNAFHEYVRQRHPSWASLKSRLHYLLTQHAEFSLWQNERMTVMCGLRTMRARAWERTAQSRLRELRRPNSALIRGSGDPATPEGLRELVARIFMRVGAPVELDRLVSVVAALTDAAHETVLESGERAAREPSDPSPGVGVALERRGYMLQVWREIRALPLRQRVALLLNFDEVHSLPTAGIAGITQIASVVGMSASQLLALWPRLPLEDAVIAEHLGTRRQQIINLRKAARDRLARRMKKNEAGGPAWPRA